MTTPGDRPEAEDVTTQEVPVVVPAAAEDDPASREDAAHVVVARGAPAMWVVMVGILLALVLALRVSVPMGVGMLSAVSAGAGIWRAFGGSPGPVGITNRSIGVDVAFFEVFAVALAFLAVTTPAI